MDDVNTQKLFTLLEKLNLSLSALEKHIRRIADAEEKSLRLQSMKDSREVTQG